MSDSLVDARMRIDAVFVAYIQGDASSIDLANTMRQHWREANKAHRIADLKASASLANNLCPDHRDKQAGKPCLACEIERLHQPSASSDASKPDETASQITFVSMAEAVKRGIVVDATASVIAPAAAPVSVAQARRDAFTLAIAECEKLAAMGRTRLQKEAFLNAADSIRFLRDTAPVGSQGGDDSGCGHDHGVER